MRIANRGLKLVKTSEGLRLVVYLCPADVATIGYGSTGSHVTMEMSPITQFEASEFLRDDLAKTERFVSYYVRVELNQNQFDALCSLIFNIGVGNFKASTLRSKLNRGDYFGAENEFWKWRRGGGKILPGLVIRRECERLLFALPSRVVKCRLF